MFVTSNAHERYYRSNSPRRLSISAQIVASGSWRKIPNSEALHRKKLPLKSHPWESLDFTSVAFTCHSIDGCILRICRRRTWVRRRIESVFAWNKPRCGCISDRRPWFDRRSPKRRHLPRYHPPLYGTERPFWSPWYESDRNRDMSRKRSIQSLPYR
jgi:hypothetical protein